MAFGPDFPPRRGPCHLGVEEIQTVPVDRIRRDRAKQNPVRRFSQRNAASIDQHCCCRILLRQVAKLGCLVRPENPNPFDEFDKSFEADQEVRAPSSNPAIDRVDEVERRQASDEPHGGDGFDRLVGAHGTRLTFPLLRSKTFSAVTSVLRLIGFEIIMPKNQLLFCLMCLIWGLTWIALKAGVERVPPLLFAGTRFVAAGLLLYGFLMWKRASLRLARRDLPRLALVTFLLITACYALLFWGTQFINSGTSAMLELSFTPVALLGFALVLREEKFSRARTAAIGLGVVGLALLFAPKFALGADPNGLRGAVAVVLAAVVYALGSVLSRPLLQRYTSHQIAAVTTFWGGLLLVGLSLWLEPGSRAALDGRWGQAAWAGWLFLVGFGSLAGYTIYLRLLNHWGASRAGAYAFVSPVIAVLAGALVYAERISWLDGAGMVIMLVAAFLAIRTNNDPKLEAGRQADPAVRRNRTPRTLPAR